jgi:hypothetical protein
MTMRTRTTAATLLLAAGLLTGPLAVAQTTQPAAQPTAPATLPTYAVPDDLTGGALAIAAQAAFNRGEYAKALPLLEKMRSEAADQPARLGSIQERIRVCEKALAAAKADPQAAAGLRPEAPPTAEERKPHAPPKDGETRELTIQGLGNFQYDQEKGGGIPADVKGLAGASVRVRGYMIPMDQAENITQFALVPSLFACCFGQPPQIQHTIVVNCPKGKAVSYYPDELVVEGKLKVEEKKDDGYVVSLFELDVTSVKPAPQ